MRVRRLMLDSGRHERNNEGRNSLVDRPHAVGVRHSTAVSGGAMTARLVADIFDDEVRPGDGKVRPTDRVHRRAVAILVAVGFYLIGKIRGRYRESDVGSSILLDNFRELHSGGQLSDEEYRNIKSKLAARLREEFEKSEQAE